MQAILFVCTHNAVRSPMAAALLDNAKPKAYYIQSAGLDIQDIDGFAIAVLHEIDVDISTHQAQIRSAIFVTVISIKLLLYPNPLTNMPKNG